MWVDTHAHVNFEAFAKDWQEVVERAVKAGVKKIIVVGADLASSKRAVELASQNKHLWASVGVHPHHARGIFNFRAAGKAFGDARQFSIFNELKKLAKHPKVVAVGEIGLDYHVYQNSKYPSTPLRIGDKEVQKELFEMQLQVAQELNKPVIIHSREAREEVLEIARGAQGVFHCFGGSKKYLKKVLAAGFYVGFTGQITYVPDRAAVAREVPLDRLLIETDCPYMPPFAKATGGKPRRSEPRDVTIIGQFLGGETEQATTANARRLFEI